MAAKFSIDIDRRMASKILGISIRTVDRYIRRGKLTARAENGRIWLDREEVKKFAHPVRIVKKTVVDARQPTDDAIFYRDLYDEAKRTLHEYQQKLEQSNYRIGQLESQVIHPRLPKIPSPREDTLSMELLRKELMDREKELILLRELVKREKINRIIFSVITYLLLLLLPVMWYLLR